MNKLTLHIGLQKTGTTYLQDDLLPRLETVEVIRGWDTHRRLMSANFNKKIIISDEGISGRLWNGTYLKDFKSNIEKIKMLYGNPKIIIGIRNQASFILSIYKQYLQEKGSKGLDFLINIDNTGIIKHDELLIKPKIEMLKKEFSEIFIYSQESLKILEQDFLIALCKFLEVDCKLSQKTNQKMEYNVGVKSNFQIKSLIRLNKLNKSLENIDSRLSLYSIFFKKLSLTPRKICQHHLRHVKSEEFELSKELKAFIYEYYSEDWGEVIKNISY
jgi:hypothetical protein